MGGKKKKRAEAAVLAAAAFRQQRPAGAERVGAESPRPTAAKPSAKEVKARAGPKTYSFGATSTHELSSAGNQDRSILKVVIKPELEQKIIRLINQFKTQQNKSGTISGRLTAKKLQDLYMALQRFSFHTKDIEEAMKNTVIYGGDLHSALDWLCLNLPDDALPDGFSQKMQEEEIKTKPKFQMPVAAATKDEASEGHASVQKPQAKAAESENTQVSMKEWILQYAEKANNSDDNDDQDDEIPETAPETEERFDPNELYLELTAKLLDTKERALSFKQNNNKHAHREAGDRIKILQQEIKQLEKHPAFDPSIKMVDLKKNDKSTTRPPDDKHEGALNLTLLEESAKKLKEETKNEPKDVRNFDYTARSWTGKSPKQFLIDWCRKNLPTSPAPNYRKISVGRFWKSRISAVSLATRVCEELGCEEGPGGKNSLCGYQIRLETKVGETSRLLYCTTGVLLRKMQHDAHLSSVSHVIVDEVHERSVQSDFLLIILKELMQKRSNLNLILMSATVDSDKFARYFGHCPVINIPGRIYPVEVFHLEEVVEETGYVLEKDSEYYQQGLDEEEEINLTVTGKGGRTFQHQEYFVQGTRAGHNLILDPEKYSSRTCHAVQYMHPTKINIDLTLELINFLEKSAPFRAIHGAVLVFLPGLAYIQQLHDLLTTDRRFQDRRRYKVIALHSILSSQDQAAAFTVPPQGVRKIVLATNIAETGITIPDVVFVIDCGKTKENRYHESSQMSSLVETFISKANALQRQGRAGRVREGFCFRLYTQERYDSFMDYSVPEILRVPLEELCLHVMKCNHGSPEDFLAKALDPPQLQVISNAMNLLKKIGACEINEAKLTPLGQHLAALPVNVKIGKMLIFGAIFGCLEPVAIIAAAMTEKTPFVTPINGKEEANLAKAALALANSDHLTIYNAYLGWKNVRYDGYRAEMTYCKKHFLSRTALLTMEDIKQELTKLMETAGFVSPRMRGTKLQRCSKEPLAEYPKKSLYKEFPLLKAVLTAGLYDNIGKIIYTPSVDITDKMICSVKYGKIYVRETTLTSPFPVLLFGGDIEVMHRERLLSVDGWIHFQAPVRTGIIFKQLRSLIESLLQKKLEDPKMSIEDDEIIQIIMELIKTENAD
ncbi:hypothetical protein scyTo_0012244 [Scyliorhinus torazame]|uniref:RNA helicase n=1 Tax=Scyliorhinus torazame TaxID=75743 RepID=A0A401P4Y9_SCYTO|nr:hypothetical protein [Scyliorhinus torazame]